MGRFVRYPNPLYEVAFKSVGESDKADPQMFANAGGYGVSGGQISGQL